MSMTNKNRNIFYQVIRNVSIALVGQSTKSKVFTIALLENSSKRWKAKKWDEEID